MSKRSVLNDLPDQIERVLTPDEIENLKHRRGWAVGHVDQLGDHGELLDTYQYSYIELFNGAGRSGEFGGVRFVTIDGSGEYQEGYAYPSREHARGNEPCYVVDEWIDPVDPDYGIPVPR